MGVLPILRAIDRSRRLDLGEFMETARPLSHGLASASRTSLWANGDLSLVEAARDGELALARLRLGVAGIMLVALALVLLELGPSAAFAILVAADAVALAHGCWMLALVRRGNSQRWIGFASTLGDISLVTLCLVGLALAGRFSISLVHAGVFPLYYLIIASTVLRYDARLCVMAVVASILQYGTFLIWVAPRIGSALLPALPKLGPGIGQAAHLSWSLELANLTLMLGAGMLALHLIARARRFCSLSTRDPLTSLLNRRFFDERLTEESERSRRGRSAFALALVDIDHFKRVNDAGGHASGDAALRAIAGAILGAFRATDTVARYGGDEFALLLPEASGTDVRARLESAAAAVSALQLPGRAGAVPIQLGLSVGVVAAPAEGDTMAALLDLADRRLYAAKAAGRGCVVGPDASDADVAAARAERTWKQA